MMKTNYVILLIVLAVFIYGCEEVMEKPIIEETLEESTLNEIAEEIPEEMLEPVETQEELQVEPVVETPEEKPSCVDECASEGCSDKRDYTCVLKEDGCKYKADNGIVKGKCGVECVFNSDCNAQDCLFYKCKAKTPGLDLSNFPNQFKQNSLIVVGADAPASDVVAATAISSKLWVKTSTKVPTKLDNDISGQESNYNLIVIGNPCNNKAVEKVFGIVCNGLNLKDGEAVIKLANNNGKTAMLISGTDPSDTLKAANKVADYEKYNFKGTEVIV